MFASLQKASLYVIEEPEIITNVAAVKVFAVLSEELAVSLHGPQHRGFGSAMDVISNSLTPKCSSKHFNDTNMNDMGQDTSQKVDRHSVREA